MPFLSTVLTMTNTEQEQKPKKKHKNRRSLLLVLSGALLLALLALLGAKLFISGGEDGPEKIPFSTLMSKVEDKEVTYINVENSTKSIYGGTSKDDPEFQSGIPAETGDISLNQLLEEGAKNDATVSADPLASLQPTTLESVLSFVPTLLIIGLVVVIVLAMGIIKLPFVKRAEIPKDLSFADVAGCGEAVEELREIENFLNNPKMYEQMGATPPNGVLLYGPPGTGKTLLAKAMAAEAQVPFFQVSGSTFIEMFAGRGAQRVRSLFREARKHAPAIIFIDELDSVGMKRAEQSSDSAMREGDQTLNAILTEMSGFEKHPIPIVVIAATNRLDTLDPALVRPGRFDRHISVDPPDRAGRLEVLQVHSRQKRINANLEALAVQTAGMTGADLALILNEAALLAIRNGKDEIGDKELDNAFLRVVAGAEKHNRAMSMSERKRVAVHEAGHGIVREILKGVDRVHKISIIPRGRSGGQTMMVSAEDIFLYSPQDIRDRIASLLAGRAAEEVVLGDISSGAADDLQKATGIGEQYAAHLGMGKSMGLRVVTEGRPLVGQDRVAVNKEIGELLDQEYEVAVGIIRSHQGWLNDVVELLLDLETIDRAEFLALRQSSSAT